MWDGSTRPFLNLLIQQQCDYFATTEIESTNLTIKIYSKKIMYSKDDSAIIFHSN